jgi:hypothetical protein
MRSKWRRLGALAAVFALSMIVSAMAVIQVSAQARAGAAPAGPHRGNPAGPVAAAHRPAAGEGRTRG